MGFDYSLNPLNLKTFFFTFKEVDSLFSFKMICTEIREPTGKCIKIKSFSRWLNFGLGCVSLLQ